MENGIIQAATIEDATCFLTLVYQVKARRRIDTWIFSKTSIMDLRAGSSMVEGCTNEIENMLYVFGSLLSSFLLALGIW